MSYSEIDQKLLSIGSTNESMREETFEYWHVQRINNKFSKEEYHYLLQAVQTNVFIGILEEQSDDVYLRSYSLLLLDCLLQADAQYDIFNKDTISKIVKVLIDYMNQEQDWRGYDSSSGYIHTLAHLSDCIYSLLNSSKLAESDKEELVQAYLNLIDTTTCEFKYLEDERIARALSALDPTNQHLMNWISTRLEYLNNLELKTEARIIKGNNYHLILKSLYLFGIQPQLIKEVMEYLY